MKVRELIELLSKENQDLEVCSYGYSIDVVQNIDNEWIDIE